MRIFLVVLVTLLFQHFPFAKTILIQTNNKKLKSKEVGFFYSRKEYSEEYYKVKKKNNFQIEKGNVVLEYFSRKDTLIIEIGKNIPLFIQGLNNIQSDSVVISNLNIVNYISIDSSITEESKPNRKGKYKITNKINYIPLGSTQITPESITVNINGKEYACTLISEPYDKSGYYCTPGKVSYFVKTNGVRKYYHLIL